MTIENLNDVLDSRASELKGQRLTSSEREELRSRFGDQMMPAWLVDVMTKWPLVGTAFRVAPEEDASEMGAEFYWLAPKNIIDEAFELYPGKLALKDGYLPIGACAIGTGDPYFLDLNSGEDPRLVRLLHQETPPSDDMHFPMEGIEEVSAALSDFLAKCEIL